MEFRDVLKGLVDNVAGAVAASLVGMDGIGIDVYNTYPELDPTVADVEFATMLKAATRAADNLGVGEVDELILQMKEIIVIAKMIGPEYYVSVSLLRNGSIGRARVEFRKVIPWLMNELYI